MRKEGRRQDSLCWDCRNAVGNCSWSAGFVPVAGWCAKKTKILGSNGKNNINSYLVKKCPLFNPDTERRAFNRNRMREVRIQIQNALNISDRQFYRLKQLGQIRRKLLIAKRADLWGKYNCLVEAKERLMREVEEMKIECDFAVKCKKGEE